MSSIVKKPILTEKSIVNYRDNNVVTFQVALNADKFSASRALESAYGVTVVSAKVVTRLGKTKFDRKTRSRKVKLPAKKIMFFKLKEGDKIDIFKS